MTYDVFAGNGFVRVSLVPLYRTGHADMRMTGPNCLQFHNHSGRMEPDTEGGSVIDGDGVAIVVRVRCPRSSRCRESFDRPSRWRSPSRPRREQSERSPAVHHCHCHSHRTVSVPQPQSLTPPPGKAPRPHPVPAWPTPRRIRQLPEPLRKPSPASTSPQP